MQLNNKQSQHLKAVVEHPVCLDTQLRVLLQAECHIAVTEFMVPKIGSVTVIPWPGSSMMAGFGVYRHICHVYSVNKSDMLTHRPTKPRCLSEQKVAGPFKIRCCKM